jgi:hypothetical protein
MVDLGFGADLACDAGIGRCVGKGTAMSLSIRGLRDGALLGILVYSLAYAGHALHDVVAPQLAQTSVQGAFDMNDAMVKGLGLAGVGYFALGGAMVGMLPWGSIFGSDPRRKKA